MYKSDEIAERIKKTAHEKGIRVTTLLENAGLNKATLANMQKSMIAADRLAKIADELDVSVDYLLGRADTRTLNVTNLSDEALSLAEAFDRADERSKAMVRLALEPFSASAASKKAM